MKKIMIKFLLYMIYSRIGQKIVKYFRCFHPVFFVRIKSFIMNYDKKYCYRATYISAFVEAFERRIEEKIKG